MSSRTDIDRIIVDNKDVAKRIKEFIKIAMPRTKNKVELYEEPMPLFHKYGIEHEIELMYSRHVPLPSGGSLVIDSTEAIVAIDVNSGKFRDHADAETTAFKTDMEAADEIPRQLRLRDLGGVIICDFIDLRYERHRRELEKRLHDNLQERPREDQGPAHEPVRHHRDDPPAHAAEPEAVDLFRLPALQGRGAGEDAGEHEPGRDAAAGDRDPRPAGRAGRAGGVPGCGVLPARTRSAAARARWRTSTKKRIVIRTDATLGLDEMRVSLFDNREGGCGCRGAGRAHSRRTRHNSGRGLISSRGVGAAGVVGAGREPERRDGQRQGPPQRREEEAAEERFDRVESEVEDREGGTEEEVSEQGQEQLEGQEVEARRGRWRRWST